MRVWESSEMGMRPSSPPRSTKAPKVCTLTTSPRTTLPTSSVLRSSTAFFFCASSRIRPRDRHAGGAGLGEHRERRRVLGELAREHDALGAGLHHVGLDLVTHAEAQN